MKPKRMALYYLDFKLFKRVIVMNSIPEPITERKIRFALVGCGRIAQNHFSAIEQHAKNAEIVGVCDIDSNALNDAVNKTGATPYKTLPDMLKKSDADIVILTTPSGLHPAQTIKIAEAKKMSLLKSLWQLNGKMQKIWLKPVMSMVLGFLLLNRIDTIKHFNS